MASARVLIGPVLSRPLNRKLKACKRGRREELNTLVCLEQLASAPATVEALCRTETQIEYNETPG